MMSLGKSISHPPVMVFFFFFLRNIEALNYYENIVKFSSGYGTLL